MVYVVLACRFLIGATFAVSAFSKIRSGASFREFASWLAGLPIPGIRRAGARASRAAAITVAAAEAAIAVAMVAPTTVRAGMLLAAGLLAAFAAGTQVAVSRGVRAPCRCFGRSAAPLGTSHVVRNLALCAVAITGAAGPAAGAIQPAGLALSLVIAAVAVLPVLFFDDLVALLAGPGVPAGGR